MLPRSSFFVFDNSFLYQKDTLDEFGGNIISLFNFFIKEGLNFFLLSFLCLLIYLNVSLCNIFLLINK